MQCKGECGFYDRADELQIGVERTDCGFLTIRWGVLKHGQRARFEMIQPSVTPPREGGLVVGFASLYLTVFVY